MPGIVGIIAKDSSFSLRSEQLQRAVEKMLYDPSYSSQTYLNPQIGFWGGVVTLGGDLTDRMPIWGADGSTGLILAGEVFCDPEQTKDGRRDEQYSVGKLIDIYERVGLEEFLRTLNGTCSGVLLDAKKGLATVFNDRYGLARLYFHETASALYFSSEAKALFHLVPTLRCYDYRGLGEYLSCGAALDDRTLFAGLSLLPAGTAWTFGKGHRQSGVKRNYFHREEFESQPSLSAEEYYEKLVDTFRRIVPKYFGSGDKISLSLTGGLDSRMVIAAYRGAPGTLNCYTHSGMYRRCIDATLAEAVANICGHPHQTIEVDQKFFSSFADLARKTVYYTDGSMDVSGAAGLYASMKARVIAPIRMTGNYGGEILRGSVMFKPDRSLAGILDGEFLSYYERADDIYERHRSGGCVQSFVAFKQVPWYHYSRLAMERTQMTVRTPFLDNEMVALSFQAPKDRFVNHSLNSRLISELDPRLAQVPTDRGRAGRPWGVPPRVWSFFREFQPRLEYVYDYGMPNWLAKMDKFGRVLRLDERILGLQKYCHFRRWYARELSGVVKETILDPMTLSLPFLDSKKVEGVVTAHTRGLENHTLAIHKLMTLAFIQQDLMSS